MFYESVWSSYKTRNIYGTLYFLSLGYEVKEWHAMDGCKTLYSGFNVKFNGTKVRKDTM